MSGTFSNNNSFNFVAAAYALNWIPHGYYFVKMMNATKWKTSNITPRTNLETIKASVPAETWSKLVRAQGCHLNALEGFPLFAAAMVAGNMAGISSRELNLLGVEYLGVRMLYNVLYMTARNEATSYMRSGVYAWSVGIPMYLLIKAGNKISSSSL